MLCEINLLELNTDLFRINAKILRITSKKIAPSFPFNVVPVWRVWLFIERVQIEQEILELYPSSRKYWWIFSGSKNYAKLLHILKFCSTPK